MLKSFDNELRTVAERVAEAERRTRTTVGDVIGREEKYTEVFRTNLEREFENFRVGRLSCKIYTYTTDKQSGEESDVGADLVFALDMKIANETIRKGILVQAKVNKNTRHGVTVDSRAKLVGQCAKMRAISKSSYVFAYGNQATKVLPSLPILNGLRLSEITDMTVGEFFISFFQCWEGDEDIQASSNRELEALVKEERARVGVKLTVRSR